MGKCSTKSMTGVLQEEGDFDTETQGRLCDDGGGWQLE